ncbi:MAG: hypothetical protein ISS72_08610 [Candidatus Brocadiae bacterium]|nr:hypothetical protein [Candidatus Brocadiia bacterium]
MWNADQRHRLAFEEKLVARYMPDFRFYDRTGHTYIDGWARTSGGANRYRLRITLPARYPYAKPQLYVISPRPMWMRGGRRTVNSLGTSHAFHCNNNGGGPVHVCYAGTWAASMTCVTVLLRGLLWLEAYEGHLRTGRNLADFLC